MYQTNRKSYIFWYRLICFCTAYKTPPSCNIQRGDKPPRNTYYGWTTGNWHKSSMQPYINMRTISSPDQFTHILPLAISYITTPRYYFQGTGRCTPHPHYTHLMAKTSTTLSQLYICFFSHFMFTCCRGKSYIGIGDMSSWTLSNLCRLLFVVVVAAVTVSCCCCSSVIVDQ